MIEITAELAIQLQGQLYTENSFYYPKQDLNDNWVISVPEIEQTTTLEFIWVKDLPLILFTAKQYNEI